MVKLRGTVTRPSPYSGFCFSLRASLCCSISAMTCVTSRFAERMGNGPAQKAGIKADDVIVQAGGKITEPESLREMVQARKPGRNSS